MSYATAADMIARFGPTELMRMTTPEGEDMQAVNTVAVERALAEASDLADSYLRGRYTVPLVAVPLTLQAHVQHLARYSLALGENREPTEQMKMARADAVAWLKGVADNTVTLEGIAPASPTQSGAMTSDRERPFNAASLARW